MTALEIRGRLERTYQDVLTREALDALEALAPLDADRKAVMAARINRRLARARNRERITFPDPQSVIPRTRLTVADARDGRFVGSDIPADLRRQWIQGTGPAARPNASTDVSIRNVAYALLSGADGWMFDGEDALGQLSTMSLDNQRNLKLAIHRDPVFMTAAERVAGEMNAWAQEFLRTADHRGLDEAARFHDEAVQAARPPSRRSTHPAEGRLRILRFHRRRHALRCEQCATPRAGGRVAGAVSPEDSDGGGSGAVE